jgi:hypothetical protein
MLALCRTGRPADALTVYEEARRRLAGAMGADLGPGPRSLHARVLRQDPALLLGPPVPVAREVRAAAAASVSPQIRQAASASRRGAL